MMTAIRPAAPAMSADDLGGRIGEHQRQRPRQAAGRRVGGRVPVVVRGHAVSSGGFTARKARNNSRPANNGLTAAPVVRATPVMPDAAARSSGATTAIV